MCVATKQSTPVATLAICLLTATPAAECEKLSLVKQDRERRHQTVVLDSSSGFITSTSPPTGQSVRFRTMITLLIFWGNPFPFHPADDSTIWKRASPKAAAAKLRLPSGRHLQSGDRGRLSASPLMRERWEFSRTM